MDTHIKGPAVNGHGSIASIRGLQTIFARATGLLTSNNTDVSNNDTVTIGTKTYTFKTALTPTEGEVLIGGTADASLLNLIRAINHTGTPNTDYKVAVANPDVTAAAAVTAHTFLVTSRLDGTASNSIVTTEVAATLSWGGTTLAGGRAFGTTAAGDRILLKTSGASLSKPLFVSLIQFQETAFDGTGPIVSIISTKLDGTDLVTTEFVIADIAGAIFKHKHIIVDRIYSVRYTAATGAGPTAGNIYSYARVSGLGPAA